MSKHTQWKVGLGYEQAEVGFWISDDKGLIILSDDINPSQDVIKLIAAAPELLDALDGIAKAYVKLLETGHDRIVNLGGVCDSVKDMAHRDRDLTKALNILDRFSQ